MNKFIGGINHLTSTKLTENGATAFESTGSKLVDLFGVIGSIRDYSDNDIISLFVDAFKEDPLLATRMAFYARDVRGGLGERKVFRTIIKWLANNYPEIVDKNMEYISVFGRWDDYYELVNTPVESEMWKCLGVQAILDMENLNAGNSISLLGKWLKSENSSSKLTHDLACKNAKAWDLSAKQYRMLLSGLRKYLAVTERSMSLREWSSISYPKVSSGAMMKYRNAFKLHDPEGYNTYLEKLVKGEEKINSSTLYPYDIVEKILYEDCSDSEKTLFNEQWKALPNYVETSANILVMADVSGSMQGRPMATSIGLATYFAERNIGAFENLYVTFTDNPYYCKINKNMSITQKVQTAITQGIGYSTNLEKAFKLILQTGIDFSVPQEQMPKALIVVSDMEIDIYQDQRKWGFLTAMKQLYLQHGYEIPNVIMWNVDAEKKTFHGSFSDPKVQFVSGQSPSTFKSILDNLDKTAYELMVNTLNSERYAVINI